MPVTKLPNGEVVYIDDDASPDAVARIMADASKRKAPVAKPKPLSAHDKYVQDHANFTERNDTVLGGAQQRRVAQGMTFNHMDEIQGAVDALTRGTYNAIKHGDVGEFKRTYLEGRDTQRELDRRDMQKPGSGVAEVLGAVVNPMGTGSGALKAMSFAPRAVALGHKIDKAPAIAQALLAGGNQGALNAIGSSEATNASDLLSAGMQGYGAGALTGGVFGGALHGGRRMKQIFADRAPEAAKRTAYMRVAQMLDNAGITPLKAQRELAATNAAGGDGMVMDLAPSLRAQAGAISRRPNVPSSNDLISRGESRIDTRPELFEKEIRRAIKPSTGQDADAHLSGIDAARKAHGQSNYDDVLDKQFVWNDELEKFVKEAPEPTRAAMKDGVKLVMAERKDPTALGMRFNEAGDVVFDRTPSMRVFDYMKRSFNQHIGQALRTGDNNTARILSGELDMLKAGITKSNPEYGNVLAGQRDFYQQSEAVNLGLDVIKRLRKEPKKVLADLHGLDPSKHDDARTGIVEAIISLRASNADPVKYLRSVMRTPTQRKVLEFAFDGKGNLARFERWMNRERRAAQADVLTAPGRQSETARFDMADESMKGSVGSTVMDAMRGFAYGGSAGAVAAGVRKFHDLRTGVGNAAMDEIAKILMSHGVELPKGVSAAEQFVKRRKTGNARAAVAAAKAGQQLFTGYTGE